MYLTALFFSIPIIIPMILVLMSKYLTKNNMKDSEKSSPFECGFDPLCSSRSSLTVRFYLMAIIFLIFDVEIVLILPLVIVKPLSEPTLWMTTFSFFLLILILGLFYEWYEGTFNWSS